MMIQILAGHGKASPEERSRIAAAAGTAMMALGIAGLAVLVLIEALGLYSISQHANSYVQGLLFGISGGLAGAGFSTAFSARKRLRDPEKMRQFEIKSRDERNLAIQSAAAKMTLVAAFVILYVMLFACAFIEPAISVALSALVVGLFVVYFFFIYLFSKKM